MTSKAAPLSETHPEAAARWQGNVAEAEVRSPDQFSVRARFECWWWCGNPDHEKFAAVPGAHLYSFQCPHCRADRGRAYDKVMASLVADVPDLVAAWRDPRPYDGLTVRDLCTGVQGQNFGQTYSLRCPNGHKLDTVVSSFIGPGCPWCRGNKTRAVAKDSITVADPELAALFHPTRNGDLTPETVLTNYRKPLWWKAAHCCGIEWEEDMPTRTLGRRPQAGRGHYYCPTCESVWGSLAWLDPELAAEWHPDNELTPWHVKPFSGGVVVTWRCSTNPEHVWDAAVSDRSSGRLCPKCSTAGTSSIEKAFAEAALALDPSAAAAKVGRWRVDVLLPERHLVLEYDGEYWHRDKREVDARKTRALLDLGYRVVRVRENELPHLSLADPRLLQLSFSPAVGRPPDLLATVEKWVSNSLA